ncbi:MAG: TRAP transporter small permease [Tannerellaceae bacterium]|nr:TRAP transporter small permease [Tannerellaceae bacterium]
MKFPAFWKKVNKYIAVVAGCLALLIAVLSVYEAIARYCFHSPTSWTLNVSCYILVWSIFLGSAYAFQEGAHVGVDMVKEWVDKRTKGDRHMPRRVMAVCGYVITFIFLLVILYGGVGLAQKSLAYNQMTVATHPIPTIWLYTGMIVGTVLMLITLVFILIDLLTGGDDYL